MIPLNLFAKKPQRISVPSAPRKLLTAHRLLLTVFALLLTAHCLLLTVSAQAPDSVDVVKIDTELVNLNVSVFNHKSQNLTTLEPKDFAVFDNGALQEVSFFAAGESPFDLVKRFVDATRSEDRIAVVTFTAEVQTVAKLTNDRDALKKSIDGIEKPVGGTNFWDALMFVLDHIAVQSRVERRRSAVVVMTDGVDNALPEVYGDGSKTTFDQLIENVRRLDTIVVPVYLDTEREANARSTPPGAYSIAREQLAMLAAESGNTVYRAAKLKDLDKAYAQVIRDLSMVYSIGYRPANRVRDGAWHTVTLRLIDHPDLEARARHGYYETRN